MSIAANATAPVGWLKAHPVVFVLAFIVLGMVVVRFRTKLYGVPAIGGILKKISGEG